MLSTAEQFLHMTRDDLDETFRSSPVGDIPAGEGRGTVIYHPGTNVARVTERLIHLIAWQGKVFDPDRGDLRNKITPLHLKRIRARVYKTQSWFDGRECIVLDYSHTSRVAHWIRDEIREASPGLYLGIVFWGRKRILNFALEFPPAGA